MILIGKRGHGPSAAPGAGRHPHGSDRLHARGFLPTNLKTWERRDAQITENVSLDKPLIILIDYKLRLRVAAGRGAGSARGGGRWPRCYFIFSASIECNEMPREITYWESRKISPKTECESALGRSRRCYCCSSWSASVSQLAAASSPATISKSLSSACSSCSHSAAAATPRLVNGKSTQNMRGQESKRKERIESEGAPLWGPIHTSKGTRWES